MNEKSRNSYAASMALAALLLAACGSERKPAEPLQVEDTVFGDTVTAMDKARGVEGTMMQQKDDLDRALQENENPAAE